MSRIWVVVVLVAVDTVSFAEPAKPIAAPLTLLPGVQIPAGTDRVKIALMRAGQRLIARARMDGQDAGFVMLDTGAAALTVDTKAAERLKLRTIGATSGPALGGSGWLGVKIHPVENLSVEGVEMGPRTFGSHDLSGNETVTHVPIAAVIGLEILGELPFTIDFREPSLTFYARGKLPIPAAPSASELPMRFIAGRVALPARILDLDGWFILDTGATATFLLTPGFVRLHGERIERQYPTPREMAGAGGVVQAIFAFYDSFSFGGKTVRNVYGGETHREQDQIPNLGDAAAGVIGCELLNDCRITMDISQRRAWVEWLKPLETDAALKQIQGEAERDPAKEPALFHALQQMRFDVARKLIEAGASVSEKGPGNQTPLMLAIWDAQLVKFMLENGADPNVVRSEGGHSALSLAVLCGQADSVKALVAGKAKVDQAGADGTTVLHLAALSGHLEMMQTLIDAGADVNGCSRSGLTPLMCAARPASTKPTELLLRHQADVNREGGRGMTALYSAALFNNPETCRVLLAAGARIDHQTVRRETALMAATDAGSVEAVEFLLRAGANRELIRGDGKRALDIAIARQRSRCERLLYFTPQKK